MIRSDLGQGDMKLYYGESCSYSYILVMDTDREIKYILIAHMEDGISIDWYLVSYDNELLECRYLKLGYKLKEISKKKQKILHKYDIC